MWTNAQGAQYYYEAEKFAEWCSEAHPEILNEFFAVKAIEDKATEQDYVAIPVVKTDINGKVV